jgi:hypothetical protein
MAQAQRVELTNHIEADYKKLATDNCGWILRLRVSVLDLYLKNTKARKSRRASYLNI